MREIWNGKGSKSRVTSYESYWSCPLWNNNSRRNRALFLDDNRDPKDAVLWHDSYHPRLLEVSGIPNGCWDIVRSYDEFVTYIDTNGIPEVVSFDNDLFEFDTSTEADIIKWMSMVGWDEFIPKTGAHCAEYLVKMCVARRHEIPVYYIHTANNAAHPIIKKILEDGKTRIKK